MLFLLYISDLACPEYEPMLIGVADCELALEVMKQRASRRFSWIGEPKYTVRQAITNQLLD